jgi:hypothetical protein
VELYLHSLNTLSWCGAQLKQRDNFTLPLLYVINCLTSLDGPMLLFRISYAIIVCLIVLRGLVLCSTEVGMLSVFYIWN